MPTDTHPAKKLGLIPFSWYSLQSKPVQSYRWAGAGPLEIRPNDRVRLRLQRLDNGQVEFEVLGQRLDGNWGSRAVYQVPEAQLGPALDPVRRTGKFLAAFDVAKSEGRLHFDYVAGGKGNAGHYVMPECPHPPLTIQISECVHVKIRRTKTRLQIELWARINWEYCLQASAGFSVA